MVAMAGPGVWVAPAAWVAVAVVWVVHITTGPLAAAAMAAAEETAVMAAAVAADAAVRRMAYSWQAMAITAWTMHSSNSATEATGAKAVCPMEIPVPMGPTAYPRIARLCNVQCSAKKSES